MPKVKKSTYKVEINLSTEVWVSDISKSVFLELRCRESPQLREGVWVIERADGKDEYINHSFVIRLTIEELYDENA